jgi:hypothetical protein
MLQIALLFQSSPCLYFVSPQVGKCGEVDSQVSHATYTGPATSISPIPNEKEVDLQHSGRLLRDHFTICTYL